MVWWVVMQVLSTLIEWIRIGRLSEQEKDLEILVLRKQLAIVEQQLDKPVRLSRAERLTLAVISAKLKAVSGRSFKQLREIIRLVQPETVIKWHVRPEWASV
jgi:putative transposase